MALNHLFMPFFELAGDVPDAYSPVHGVLIQPHNVPIGQCAMEFSCWGMQFSLSRFAGGCPWTGFSGQLIKGNRDGVHHLEVTYQTRNVGHRVAAANWSQLADALAPAIAWDERGRYRSLLNLMRYIGLDAHLRQKHVYRPLRLVLAA